MAKTSQERLSIALQTAHDNAINNIVQSHRLDRRTVTFLKAKGFLKPIIRGWYLLDADVSAKNTGDSALWQESIWAFYAQYLAEKEGENYCLAPDISLDLHTGNNQLPQQLLVYTTGRSSVRFGLPDGTQLLRIPMKTLPDTVEHIHGLRVYPLGLALAKASPGYFRNSSLDARIALQMTNFQVLSRALLETKNYAAMCRLVGAYEQLGDKSMAKKLTASLESAGFDKIVSVNPFDKLQPAIIQPRLKSPYAARLAMLWQSARSQVIDNFPEVNRQKKRSIITTLKEIDDIYVHDAYHSLSIEGYSVTPELIRRVSQGDWHPDKEGRDRDIKNALAAKGYWDAFNKVKQSIRELYEGEALKDVIDTGIQTWYAALFGPCVDAGIIPATDLAGYRTRPVYIRGSRHVPPAVSAVMDTMEQLLDLIAGETHGGAAAVLGHHLLGYIHPYPDGNGRTARFLMNLLFTHSGYPWTIIRIENRRRYLVTLEQASIHSTIKPFTEFIVESMGAVYE